MMSYCALAILAVLMGANADNMACSKQMELEHRCMLNVQTSAEATMIKDRMKATMKTCAPDYPQECHAEMEAAHDCMVSIAKNADNDQLLQDSKSKTQPAVDACFAKYPPDVKKGFMSIFMDAMHGGKKHHHKHHHNDTSSGEASGENMSGESSSAERVSGESSSSNETDSFERRHGGGGGRGGGGSGGRGGGGRHHGGGSGGRGGRGGHGGRGGGGGRGRHCHHRGGRHGGHHGPKNFTGEWNDTSSSASGEHQGQSGESSGEHWGKPQCRKTPEQHKCMKDELQKLAKDSAFLDVMNTLIHQKQKCKSLVDWSCEAKCPKQKKCLFQASKPCREAFMTRMQTCLQEKGFTLPPRMQHHEQGTDVFTTPLPILEH